MVQLYVTYKKFTLSLGEKSIKMRNQRNRYDNGKRKRKKSQPNLYQINYVLVKKKKEIRILNILWLRVQLSKMK